MSTNLRTLGVKGKNLPAKKTISVQASDFSIGGLLVETERYYDKSFKVKNVEEYVEIFGNNIDATQYGADAVKSFFDNVVGVDATLYVQSLTGYDITGDAIDGIQATIDKVDDGADMDAYVISAAFEGEVQYGVSGNQIGTKFTQVTRFTTAAAAGALATAMVAELDSVIGFKVGDIVRFDLTVAGTESVYHKLTEVDQSAGTITWTDSQLAAVNVLTIDDVVSVPGFRVQTYYKSVGGIETEVDVELGKKICSSESEVTDFYVDNIFNSVSKWITITEASASSLEERFPADDATPIYLASGSDGTANVTAEAQAFQLLKFDDDPIRFLANPETTLLAMQKALVTYSLARDDNPIVIFNTAENQTKSQLEAIGGNFQRSDYYPAVLAANWLKVTDPFNDSANAPDRTIPNVGYVMGAWIKSIGLNGIHYIPATNANILNGLNGVRGDQFLNDDDRTDLAKLGVNVIQVKTGIGTKIANLFTMSTDTAYQFANGILMRNFIKVSAEDSLSASENTPNSLNRVTADRNALLSFMFDLWNNGSTGSVPTGETFGQGLDDDGNPTVAEDHFEVVADNSNNPQSSLDLGERNINVFFSFPAPAGSIFVGIGILLRG